MWSDYTTCSGTVPGEIRNEIYNCYGQEIMETAIYDWHIIEPDALNKKFYTLVNTTPKRFLIATVSFYPRALPKSIQMSENPVVADMSAPETIHLEWIVADVPFLPKYTLDAENIPYTL